MSGGGADHVGPRGGGGRAGALRAWLIWWVLCAALWLALVDRVALSELLTGVVAAAIGATAAVLVRQQRETVVRPRARWLPAVGRAALSLVTDLWPLGRALVARGILRRDQVGVVHELRFDAVGDDPEQAAFRVLTETLGSLGPNTIVVDIDLEAHVLYAHQLVPEPDPARSALPLS
jgi:multisubunit Na+/H+ antiporter MnhE subunit